MTESRDSEDFIDNVRRDDAIEAARQRALDGPSRRSDQRRRTKRGSANGYAITGLRNETEAVRTAVKGSRQTTLNTACFNVGQLVQPGGLDYDEAKRELISAALYCGLTRKELKSWDLPDRGLKAGMRSPRDLDEKARAVTKSDSASTSNSKRSSTDTDQANDDDEWEPDDRAITWVRASTVKTRVPQWVWYYEGAGRIQLGTVTMFAGKPAAGKSTASRWFASQISRGTLPGCWEGTGMNVAMVSFEEQDETTIVPSLQVAGADVTRIILPRFTEAGRESAFQSVRDEEVFTDGLVDNDIRAVFIDPVMNAIGGKADVYRNNEVRQYLEPFVRIAKEVNGIVVCVHHLRKGTVQDVLGSMNGSSAFGEVPRAVFGFAPFEGGAHVMEQVKNSAGPTGLALEYHLPIEYTQDEDGVPFELPRFEIKGTTSVSISDIDEAKDELTGIAFASTWLSDYLLENQPMPVWQIQKDAKAAGAINNDKMLSRAGKRLGVVSRSQPVKDKPNQHVWVLPEFAKGNPLRKRDSE